MKKKKGKEGRLFVISAPSGAGKSTLEKKLMKSCPDLQISVSYTTRSPRAGEKEGKDYFFISPADFRKKAKEGFFAEWAKVFGNYYGTSCEYLNSTLKKGDAVLVIDTRGAFQIRKKYPDKSILIFIAPPSMEELKRRLVLRRTESEQSIRRRLRDARREMKESIRYDLLIINDRLEKAVEELRALITTHRRPPVRGSALHPDPLVRVPRVGRVADE